MAIEVSGDGEGKFAGAALLWTVARHDDLAAEEISCSECFDLLSAGVELELAGATWEPGLTRLGRHLGQCRVCRDEYETLRDFVRFEAEKPTLPPDSTSPVPECSARKIPLESDT